MSRSSGMIYAQIPRPDVLMPSNPTRPSYPYFSIATRYGVDHGLVLHWLEVLEESVFDAPALRERLRMSMRVRGYWQAKAAEELSAEVKEAIYAAFHREWTQRGENLPPHHFPPPADPGA